MVAIQFNSQGIDPEFNGFNTDPIWPAGWFKVVITETKDQALNDASKGRMLVMPIRIIEGNGAGMTGTMFCNLFHTDPSVRDRAAQQMAAICFATGKFAYNNTDELVNLPFWIENQIGRKRKANDGKEYDQNNFVGVRNLAGVEPGKSSSQGGNNGGPPQGMPQPPQPPQQQAPQAAGWGNGAPPAGPASGFAPTGMPVQGNAPAPNGGQGGWAPNGNAASPSNGQQGGWGPPQGGAPAAPSFAPPNAPANGPAPQQGQPQQGWGQPPNGAPPQGQPPQQPPQQQGWAPQGQPPQNNGGAGWGPGR